MIISLSNRTVQFQLRVDGEAITAYPSLKKLSKKKKVNTTCDIVYKINGLFTLLQDEGIINTYLEPMAGVGFSASLVEAMFHPTMILNDLSKPCYKFLKGRFPGQTVFNQDCRRKIFTRKLPTVDCCFVDPNRNLFKHDIDLLEPYLNKAHSTLICTDSLPFSWAVPWSEATFKDYLKHINRTVKWVNRTTSVWSIKDVYLYPHKRVMIVKFKKYKSKIRMVTCKGPFCLRLSHRVGLI